ncbi:ABC transporter ATP-binding protein [Candidatus Mycoplasma pogonae]
MNHILQVKKLTKIYSTKDNQGIFSLTFNVNKGSFHVFIGENGSGKTTTIKCIVGSYTNWTGEVLIDNLSNQLASSKIKLGYVPEAAKFPKELTTQQYLLLFARMSGVTKADAIKKIDDFLKEFEIQNLKNKKPAFFSSGQQKKVLLIQALIHNPEIIILDEPAANLDPTARYELFSILENLKKNNKTIFISSHILSEVNKYADSLTLIHKGKIVYSGAKYDNLESIYYEKITKKS